MNCHLLSARFEPGLWSFDLLRVLIVEDDPGVLAITERMLIHEGLEVVGASDGEAAVSIAQHDDGFDVALLDVVVPGKLSGMPLADALKQAIPSLGIVFMTGYPSDVFEGEPRAASNHVLMKPINRAKLVDTLAFASQLVEAGKRDHHYFARPNNLEEELDFELAEVSSVTFHGCAAPLIKTSSG
jgi:CheY-like chemotaxis protein